MSAWQYPAENAAGSLPSLACLTGLATVHKVRSSSRVSSLLGTETLTQSRVLLSSQVLEIVNDSTVRRLHEPRAVNQGEPKAPDTPQGESTRGPDLPPWPQDKQPQPVAVHA